jgi:hypothetical protein
MTVPNTVGFRPAPNHEIMNALKGNMSNAYQDRVPDATRANIADSISAIMDFEPNRNEFIGALVNRIGLVIARNNNWTNPLGKFKRGMLEWGDSIEEIQVGLAKAYVYDPQREYLEEAIFGQETPETQSSFHQINRQNYYKITVNDAMLRRAFLDEMGLSNLVQKLMDAPTTSDQWDEFLLMADLFQQYETNDGFYKIHIDDVSAQGSTQAQAQFALRRIRESADNLGFISRKYNAAAMPVSANKDELELFVTPEFNAAIDVEALAAAFNVPYAAIPSRQTVIPADQFPADIQAVLTTRDFFVVADTLFETRSAMNPVGLTTNYFLHHHQIISVSRFVPAIAFTTGDSTVEIPVSTPVTSVTVPVVTDRNSAVIPGTGLPRGDYYDVASTAVTTPAGGTNDAVELTLTGNLSPRTFLTNSGTLYVSDDEAGTVLTITATATDPVADGSAPKTANKAYTLTGDVLVFWPRPVVEAPDEG